MKFITPIIILTIVLLGFSNLSKAQNLASIPLEYYANERIVNNMEFTENGNTYKVQNSKVFKGIKIMKDGRWLLHGVHYQIYDGKLKRLSHYQFGKKEGLEITYGSNGNIEYKKLYKDHKKDGVEEAYYDDGSLRYSWPFKNGKMHGMKITYENGREGVRGKISSKGEYKDGKQDGRWISYNSDGKVRSVAYYENGKYIRTDFHY